MLKLKKNQSWLFYKTVMRRITVYPLPSC